MTDRIDVVVVGAGMAGLTAARSLAEAGHSVVVLDKGRAVGGRMATKRNAGARYDHGAQRFSARFGEFAKVVDNWIEAHIVKTWFEEDRIVDGEHRSERRLVGVNGMRGICEYLARDLDVRTATLVSQVVARDGEAVALSSTGPVTGRAAIVTAPVPQMLNLVDLTGEPDLRSELEGVRYDPCLTVMAQVRDTRHISSGRLAPESRSIAWIADNQHKGVSAIPAITIHAAPGFSEMHLESEPSEWVPMLVEEATKVLDSPITAAMGHRWRYSEPQSTLGTSCAVLDGSATIVLAGEAFVSPRVEGAYLSGLAAARAVMDRLA